MFIEKVNIKNYKCFEGWFSIDLSNGVNILVGDNEAGKSTILEAIHLALTGILGSRYLKNSLSQYLFNHKVVSQYILDVKNGNNPTAPDIAIEVFFSSDELPVFEGNGNSEREKKAGVVLKIELDPDYEDLYEKTLENPDDFSTMPIEYYRVTWKSFARDTVVARSIPLKSALIDSTSRKYQNGSDVYISRIIHNDLEKEEEIQLSQAYRRMKESFMNESSIQAINDKIKLKSKVTEKDLKISVDLSAQNSWDTNLMTYLDEVPFHQIGKGEQCIIKTNLALGHHKSQEANLILLEEPENHLSHTRLNELIKNISDNCAEKQVIVSTHSSFVANKLGLEHILLLNQGNVFRLSQLSKGTWKFFMKLPGYQTLRLLLCKKAVLVEGDSDELIFQRAYMDVHDGRLPIENGIDVISVGLTFLRFLEIAKKIEKPVAVITDNDHDYDKKIVGKYKDYADVECVSVFADNRNDLNTLEPQVVDSNLSDLENLCEVIGIKHSEYDTKEKVVTYMLNDKTRWALRAFEADKKIKYPSYITQAIEWCE